ncbi:uncharacterized protein LOC144528577 [Sander vitreus]
MCKVQMLRALVEQRLTAAAEEIFGLFERTIAEYEEELCRSKEENERQRELLDAVFNPQLRLHRADVQQLSVVKEEVAPEQQECSSGVDQQEPEPPPHIKEEQEERWSSQEGEQLQGLEEADITKYPFTPVKSEDDEEEAQSSQFHQRKTQHMEIEADGEDCGGPEPARNSHPHPLLQPETEDQASDFPEPRQLSSFAVASQFCQQRDESREPQLGFTSPKKSRYNSREKLFRCSECGKQFNQNSNLKTHMRTHTGEKPFSCPFCSKRFGQKAHLQNHLKCHTGEKPYRCSVCGRRFSRFEHMKLHMRTHTGERPFSCNSCGKRFTWLHQFKTHKCGGESSQQEELWSSQEGEQLQGLEEADITKFPFTPLKSEDDEEKAQSSQLHQRQSHPDSFYSHGLECNSFIGQFW